MKSGTGTAGKPSTAVVAGLRYDRADGIALGKFGGEQLWLVDWGDGTGPYLCLITKDKDKNWCAESIVSPRDFPRTFEIEPGTLVRPVKYAAVDWRDGRGALAVARSLDDKWRLVASEFGGQEYIVGEAAVTVFG